MLLLLLLQLLRLHLRRWWLLLPCCEHLTAGMGCDACDVVIVLEKELLVLFGNVSACSWLNLVVDDANCCGVIGQSALGGVP